MTAGTRQARALAERAGEDGGVADQRPAGERMEALYSGSWMQMQAFARALLERGGQRGGVEPPKERALRRFLAADSSVAAAMRFGLRGLRPLVGRDETQGRERALAAAVIRHRLGR